LFCLGSFRGDSQETPAESAAAAASAAVHNTLTASCHCARRTDLARTYIQTSTLQVALNVLQTLEALDQDDDPDATKFVDTALGDADRAAASGRLRYMCFYGSADRLGNFASASAAEPPRLPARKGGGGSGDSDSDSKEARSRNDVDGMLQAGAQCTKFFAQFTSAEVAQAWVQRHRHGKRDVESDGEHHNPNGADDGGAASMLLMGVFECLFLRVAQRSAAMVAAWMATGFVHGVMNTDNMCVRGGGLALVQQQRSYCGRLVVTHQ
jgi:hypothetical protein